MRKIWYILLAVVLAACEGKPELEMTVHECAPMPSPRACATAFVVGEEVYLFGGRDAEGTPLNDLWQYDSRSDRWISLGATPLSPRVNATACVANGKVYIGLGFRGREGRYGNDTTYLRDWWEFAPATGEWIRKEDYPNSYTNRATCFVEGERLFVGYGFQWNYRRDFFCYDIPTNRWDSIDVNAGFHGFPTRSFGGTGCTCRGRHFMGSGYYGGSLDWWGELAVEEKQEDGSVKGHWIRRAGIPGQSRTLAASCATQEYIYLSGGMHYGGINTTMRGLQDIRRYNPTTDRWEWVCNLPVGLINHISFAIGKRVYSGLGETVDTEINNRIYYIEE